jgi:DNA-binding transcriptional ArsR family regulator
MLKMARHSPKATHTLDALDALGSPIRREILRILCVAPLSVGDIARQLPISRPAVSKHLRLLAGAGLVRHEQLGTRNVYRLESGGFDDVRRWVDEFWDQALRRFSLVAENTTPEGS